jgi:hypothetical protein
MNATEQSNEPSMQLRVAFMHWAICLGALLVLLILGAAFQSSVLGNLALLFYIGAGIYLSRAVLRRIVEWHPMYNTLENVSSEKFSFFLFWPLKYLSLFLSLGINKLL